MHDNIIVSIPVKHLDVKYRYVDHRAFRRAEIRALAQGKKVKALQLVDRGSEMIDNKPHYTYSYKPIY